MPNPTPAEYTVQLGPTVTPEVAGELAAWAELSKVSTSKLTRRVIDAGLEALRAQLASDVADSTGATPPVVRARFAEVLPKHLGEAVQRGERQVKRRRDYDSATRTPIAQAAPAPVKRARAKRSATA